MVTGLIITGSCCVSCSGGKPCDGLRPPVSSRRGSCRDSHLKKALGRMDEEIAVLVRGARRTGASVGEAVDKTLEHSMHAVTTLSQEYFHRAGAQRSRIRTPTEIRCAPLWLGQDEFALNQIGITESAYSIGPAGRSRAWMAKPYSIDGSARSGTMRIRRCERKQCRVRTYAARPRPTRLPASV